MLHVNKDKLHIPVGSNHEVVWDSAFLKREVQLFAVTPWLRFLIGMLCIWSFVVSLLNLLLLSLNKMPLGCKHHLQPPRKFWQWKCSPRSWEWPFWIWFLDLFTWRSQQNLHPFVLLLEYQLHFFNGYSSRMPVRIHCYQKKKSSSTIANYGNSMATFHLSRSSDVDTAHSLIVNFNQHTDTAKEAQIEPKSSVLTTSRQSSWN